MKNRSLAELQKQYARAGESDRGGMGMRRPGPGGPGGRHQRGSGKPKEMGKTVRRLLTYVGKYKARLVLVFCLMIVQTLTSLLGSYMLAPIINRITEQVLPDVSLKWTGIGQKADAVIGALAQMGWLSSLTSALPASQVMAYILAAVIIMAVIYLAGIVCSYLQNRLMVSVSLHATERIRADLFDRLQNLPVRYFDNTPTGEIMSRFTNDVDNIDTMFSNSLVSLLSGTISLIGTFLFMISTNWILTLVTVAFIPIFALGGGKLATLSGKHYSGQQAALGAINGYIEETVSGQKVIKVFNHEEVCGEEFRELNGDLREKQLKAQFFGGIMGPVMGNTSQISYAVTVGIGGILMCTTGFGPGDLTVFANYARQFSMPINMISQQMSSVFAALAGAERIFAVMDMPPEEPDKPDAEKMPYMRGDVVLEHVTFGYRPDKTVLKDISLYAHPGQKIAFVGSTGAGKTTITNLINRFYDVGEGRILIDGVDVRDIRRDVLRSDIAMVLQDTHLFTGTVRENIRYGRLDATDEEVEQAARTASAHSFIMRLENGYDTMIEGDGANLSQGQRQLLNIARAAVSRAPILVLDEATSSVDTRTERHIEHGMDRLMKNRTTFVIAHRLSTVRNADAIMVLENGEIIERGTHEQLLEQKGRYYELYTGKRELD